tara:strand:+ start:229 stop:1530 length:1302 start_codon:yes stop_codon:yes gene_type:complete
MQDIPEEKENNSEEQNDDFAKLSVKEVLDKTGFGFGSQQFINILLLQTGASFFLLGIINSLRVVFGNLTYFFIENFKNIKISKKFIGISGIVFGFSFLLMAIAIFLNSVVVFSVAILIGSISIVIYGEAKNLFNLSKNKAFLTEKIAKYSLIITAISLFIAAYLMDTFPASGTLIIFNIFNKMISFKVYGYLIVFEIAAIAFIVAGYILSHLKGEAKTVEEESPENEASVPSQFKTNFNFFVKNKVLIILIIVNILISIVQITGYSYYGIFVYQNFNNEMFGGFLNVAMIFLISVFTSLIGYFITRINARSYRKFPILIFGTIMLALMPFSYYFNPSLIFITMGTILGIIGGSIVGVTNSLLAIELINFDMRQSYFSFTNLISLPFFLIIIPVLAYIAQTYGLTSLFLVLTYILAALVIILITASILFRKELT